MQKVKQIIESAGVIQQGHFIFADGDHALTKLEMDKLWEHPQELAEILALLAEAKGLPPAEVMLGVPTGGQCLASELRARGRLQIPLAKLERVPGGAKQDFRFASKEDEALARSAKSVRIYEDVVTTLSSIAGVVKLLDPEHQDIHSLAIWRRGEVKEHYRQGISEHYLVEELIPSFSPEHCPHPSCKNI